MMKVPLRLNVVLLEDQSIIPPIQTPSKRVEKGFLIPCPRLRFNPVFKADSFNLEHSKHPFFSFVLSHDTISASVQVVMVVVVRVGYDATM
jgi:hypothetical protein